MLEKNYLYNRIKIVWMFPVFILLFISWTALFILTTLFTQQMPVDSDVFLYAIGITSVILLSSYAYAELRYWNYFYEFKDSGLRISHGIIEKRVDSIPYSKIQHLRAERSISETLLGLVHIHIDMAGLSPSERLPVIPGVPIEAYEEMISFIKNKTSPGEGDKDGYTVFIPPARSQDEMLRLMLEQLVLVNKRLADMDKGSKPDLIKKKAKPVKKDKTNELENRLEEESIRTHL